MRMPISEKLTFTGLVWILPAMGLLLAYFPFVLAAQLLLLLLLLAHLPLHIASAPTHSTLYPTSNSLYYSPASKLQVLFSYNLLLSLISLSFFFWTNVITFLNPTGGPNILSLEKACLFSH